MRFTSTINNVRLLEWDINITQGALVDLINQASSWAQAVVINGKTLYWMSFSKVCEELPSVFTKEDTVYRQYKVLKEKGIIEHIKMDGKDYVRLTDKGCDWNKFEPIRHSEKNPSNGKPSEDTRKKIRENSEKNPTDNNNNNKYNQDQNPPVAPQGAAPAAMVLDYLNSALATLAAKLGEAKSVQFKQVERTHKLIAKQIADFSQAECELVIDYLVAKWGRDEKMRDYLTPKTIFRPSNFAEYVPMSLAWSERGRPVSVCGKWVRATDVETIANMPSVEEVRNLYLKSLGMGNPFKHLDFNRPHDKILYYAVIGTKSKKPLERDLRNVIVSEINAVAERIDQLKTPNFSRT